jgi:hypothetical protein
VIGKNNTFATMCVIGLAGLVTPASAQQRDSVPVYELGDLSYRIE